MSISTKVTYITTVISAIILAIVLIFIYSTIQNLIIKSTKADLLESARLPMMRHMRKDIYLLKDGILISDPYGLGIMNKNGKIKINDRVYLFVKPYQNTIIAKDITSIENFILNIKKRFITLFIFSTLLISFSTYLITKNSMNTSKIS